MNAPFPIIEIIKFNYVKIANQLTYSDDSYRVFVTTFKQKKKVVAVLTATTFLIQDMFIL